MRVLWNDFEPNSDAVTNSISKLFKNARVLTIFGVWRNDDGFCHKNKGLFESGGERWLKFLIGFDLAALKGIYKGVLDGVSGVEFHLSPDLENASFNYFVHVSTKSYLMKGQNRHDFVTDSVWHMHTSLLTIYEVPCLPSSLTYAPVAISWVIDFSTVAPATILALNPR